MVAKLQRGAQGGECMRDTRKRPQHDDVRCAAFNGQPVRGSGGRMGQRGRMGYLGDRGLSAAPPPTPPHTRRQGRTHTRAHTHYIQPLRTVGKPPTHSKMAHLRSPTEAWDRMGARLPRKPPPAAPMHMLTKAMRKLMTVGCWYSSCLKVTSCSGCNRQFMHGFSTSQQLLKQERWG